METRKLLEDMANQTDERIAVQMQRSLGGRSLTPEQEAVMNRAHDKIAAVVKETISWQAMEPMAIRIYRESLTQEELDGILAFYKTPAGAALIKKMPRLAQAMSEEMQKMLQSMVPKVTAIAKESDEEMKRVTPVSDPRIDPCKPPASLTAPSALPAPCQNAGASPKSDK
jgi:hypothetical protein